MIVEVVLTAEGPLTKKESRAKSAAPYLLTEPLALKPSTRYRCAIISPLSIPQVLNQADPAIPAIDQRSSLAFLIRTDIAAAGHIDA